MPRFAFWLYALFATSWFLHAAARIPVLGTLRVDLLLVLALMPAAFLELSREGGRRTSTDTALWTLIAYAVLTVPLVEWPGSVLNNGLPEFMKAVIFYFFTVAFVKSETDLKRFVALLVCLQSWRVLEPVYLHLADGYWGSIAYMSGGEEGFERLAGAPHDVINPNGLAFVICSILPFALWLGMRSWKLTLLAAPMIVVCLYALMLTSSRTGFLGFVVVYLALLVKSRRRLVVIAVGAALFAYGATTLDANLQDRYLSIVGLGSKNLGTAAGRVEAIGEDFTVAMRRPLFGHGLGTSSEANYHFAGIDQLSHNLYAEVAQEIGFVGLAIFAWLMLSISRSLLALRSGPEQSTHSVYLDALRDALLVWYAVVLLFSFASYGLSSYEWYLLGGMTVVVRRLSGERRPEHFATAATGHASRRMIYVDFEQLIQPASAGGGTLDSGVRAEGLPDPGAIEFLREAVGSFSVVICSPKCGSAEGKEAVSGWLREHGAPVSQLRFGAAQPIADSRSGRVIGFSGRWPTAEDIMAIASENGNAR